ncbi:MAG TPA: alpha-2-macroglobulin family protein, partial [Bacteroidales bacterium]|nr:alpha-2-macroglobulin family protein [Bacteroidales bacterium]
NGEVSFTFTAPESLTEWKFMAVAHTEDLKTAVSENKMVTKKKLMVVPNMPRFFREGDQINLSIKVTNLTDQPVEGNLNLHFTDALTGKDVTKSILNGSADDDFSIKANGNTAVDMNLNIPEGLQAIEYKVIASTEKYGDGEQRLVPVLSNRMLVTESMPMYVNGNSSKTWRFKKLSKSDRSGSLKHHKLSLEVTPRPAWYAVQALPYLMEYPYECSEQVFSRYYANSLATHIANSDPEIKRVFEAWRNIPESDALNSNLQKNQDLKANMLEQTPWVLEAKDESQRKRRVGLLFDMERMGREQFSALVKLQKNQVSSGGWPWFEGMPESRYITQHIIAGLSHLKHLDVLDSKQLQEVNPMIRRGLKYLDRELVKDYSRLKSYYSDEEMQQMHISSIHVHYLYARSFNLDDMQVSPSAAHAYKYYYNQAKKYWAEMNNYNKGMIALAMHRNDEKATASDIMASLKEYALFDEEKGMYWKNARGYYWYQAPIETQSLLIEAFDEVAGDTESVERMKQWLLNQKRTQDWKTTKATAEAVYALILTGQNLLDLDAGVVVEIGGKVFDPEKADDVTSEAGTGYFRKDWSGGEITSEMSEVKLTKTGSGMAWGALHWQYFEDMDKITSHETPLKLEKKLYKRINTHDGAELKLLDEKTSLKVGDKLVARIVLKSDRNMEYVHMKDMRASSLEPVSTRSGYRYQDGLGYYESVRDASVDFF